jgi:phosphohistidine swiveling domain-containing protein
MNKILQGMGVSHGKIRGKVKVIRDLEDYSKFDEGDILVARLTDPSMVILMGKAAGIICDIGGLTSHPSILSREMGIPCIVSASCEKTGKKATEILENDMIISMNGETGEIYLEKVDNKGIKEFIKSISIAMENMDPTTLEPMSNFMFHPLFSKEWVDKIEESIRVVEENNISIEDMTKYISGPSHLRAQFLFLLLDLKCAKIEKERRLKIANFFNSLLKKKALDDIYGIESNIIHSNDEIGKIINRIKFNEGNEEISKLLGRLYSSAYHLVNGLYTDFNTDFGVECFGQYRLDDKHILVIKQFNDLNPKELWPEIKSPCKNLVIYTIYKNIKFKCDAISIHSIYEGDPIKNLVLWVVEVDGKFINSRESLLELKNKLEVLSIEQWKRLISLEFEELKIKGLFMGGYVFKNFFNKLNIDWRPSQEMIDVVKNKEFADESYWGVPEDGKEEYWKKLLDPEIDFYPKMS